EPIGAEFANIQRDSKKTAIKLNVKSDAKGVVNQLYPFAGGNVDIILEPSQMSIDEFYEEPHEGMEYNVKPDGTTEVAPGQLIKIVDGETIAE
ncbi:hypothetical protein P4H40_27805, partial [Bacillus cereus]|nr:hypothetical protein [Bacillus cereus]